ncbi:MAG: hypothetical protein ACTSYI_11395 [Promethearchaeota archaeon]
MEGTELKLKPFLKISIVSTTETTLNSKQILEIVRRQVDTSQIMQTSFTSDAEGKTTLVLTGNSNEDFRRFFKQDFVLMDKLMEKMVDHDFNLRQFFPVEQVEQKSDEFLENYLVLRYSTSYPDTVRENLQYFQFFSDQMNEFIHFEEIEGGFLRFYKRKIDYICNNMERNTIPSIQKWLKIKGVSLPPELMELMIKIIPPE